LDVAGTALMAITKTKINAEDFRVGEREEISLAKWPTRVPTVYTTKEQYKAMLRKHVHEIAALQDVLYASDRYALLLIFQGMDAAGKDSVIKHVMSGINPQGCQAYSFKQPSEEELDHDFLWRVVRRLPQRGRIGIFNRSHYEEVLVVRVHPEILMNERLPKELLNPETIWTVRYRSIVEFEEHLYRSGTRTLKFYLHLSKEEQRRRFLKRLEEPEKNWKFSMSDIKERKFWRNYMEAYEACINATSSGNAPWYIIPADDKANVRLLVSEIVHNTLRELKLAYPRPDRSRLKEFKSIRKRLEREE
jgi:PPK2 family polyphosphate:nucleotide phosphotransferase